MVNLSLDKEVVRELYANSWDIKQEFSKMDAFMFVYCTYKNLIDCVKANSFWEVCDDNYAGKVLLWINFWENYRVN